MTVEKYLKWSNDEQDLHLASLQNSKTQNLNNIFSLLRGKAKKAKPKTDLKQYHCNGIFCRLGSCWKLSYRTVFQLARQL